MASYIDKAKVDKIVEICHVPFPEACTVLESCYMDLDRAINRFLSGMENAVWTQVVKKRGTSYPLRVHEKDIRFKGVQRSNVSKSTAVNIQTVASVAQSKAPGEKNPSKAVACNNYARQSTTQIRTATTSASPVANQGRTQAVPDSQTVKNDMKKRQTRGRKHRARMDAQRATQISASSAKMPAAEALQGQTVDVPEGPLVPSAHSATRKDCASIAAAKATELPPMSRKEKAVSSELPVSDVPSSRTFHSTAACSSRKKQPLLPTVQIENAIFATAESAAVAVDLDCTQPEPVARAERRDVKKKRNHRGRKHRAFTGAQHLTQDTEPTPSQSSVDYLPESTVDTSEAPCSAQSAPRTAGTAAAAQSMELPIMPQTDIRKKITIVDCELPVTNIAPKGTFKYESGAVAGTSHAKLQLMPTVHIAVASSTSRSASAVVYQSSIQDEPQTENGDSRTRQNRGLRKHWVRTDTQREAQGAEPTVHQPQVKGLQELTVGTPEEPISSAQSSAQRGSTASAVQATELPLMERDEPTNEMPMRGEAKETTEQKPSELVGAVMNPPGALVVGGAGNPPVLQFGSFGLHEREPMQCSKTEKCARGASTLTADELRAPRIPGTTTVSSTEKILQVPSSTDSAESPLQRESMAPSGAVGNPVGFFHEIPPQTYPPYYMGMNHYYGPYGNWPGSDMVSGEMGPAVLPGAMYQPPAQNPYPVYGFPFHVQPGMQPGVWWTNGFHFGYTPAGPATSQSELGAYPAHNSNMSNWAGNEGRIGLEWMDGFNGGPGNGRGRSTTMLENRGIDARSVPNGHKGVAGDTDMFASVPADSGTSFEEYIEGNWAHSGLNVGNVGPGRWTNRQSGNILSGGTVENRALQDNVLARGAMNSSVYAPMPANPVGY